MTYPQLTFELKITFDPKHKKIKETKRQVMEWLSAHGVDEFVEGVMDGLDIDNEYTGPNQRDFYNELGGDLLPVSVYKYSKELLEDLKIKLEKSFGNAIELNIHVMETSEWLEGWKESFKPIITEKFYIYPPWDKAERPKDKISIVVEPGMAFGTGQHATTQVCLRRIEKLFGAGAPLKGWRLCDVGTGTGILALGACFLGFGSVAGTDIDPDAIIASKCNAEMNKANIPFWQGSSPVNGVHGIAALTPPFDVVVANILFVVLSKIIPELAQITKVGGLLILSGVLSEDGDLMISMANECGMRLVDRSDLDGWACITLTKN